MKKFNNYTTVTHSFLPKQLLRYTMVITAVVFMSVSAKAQIAPVNPPAGEFHIDGDLRANTPQANIGDWINETGGSGGFVFNNDGSVNGGVNAALKRPL